MSDRWRRLTLNLKRLKAVFFLLVFMLLSSCFSSPTTRFYLLSPLPEEDRRPAPERSLAIGVGPVRFPDYLDRPQIATGNNPNQLNLNEFHQWAESLQNNFSRVLSENLALLIPTQTIASFPWDRTTRIDYQVKVDVVRFIVDERDDAILIARWRVVGGKEGITLTTGKSDIRMPVTSGGYEAIVAVLSRTLAQLSEEIAAAIRLIAKIKPGVR